MKPRITLITLGVDDLERAVRFYRERNVWKPGMDQVQQKLLAVNP